MNFSDSERKLMLELIGNEQIHMLIKDERKYDSDKYKRLEELKIKVNNLHKFDINSMGFGG